LDTHEKTSLLLERGADTASCSEVGESCLQLVLGLKFTKDAFSAYQENEFKDILMCIVTAGGDVYAADEDGMTVSQTACQYGHEELWREVLAECGYNPGEVFSLEGDFGRSNFREHRRMGVFAAATPNVRSTKLSFKEYGQQRKSLDCVRKVYCREKADFWAVQRECYNFWDTYFETSDTEDYYEWGSVDDERYNDDETAAGYPELLHNGVPWQIVFC